MVSKSIFLRIIAHVVLITLLAVGMVVAYVHYENIATSIILGGLLLTEVWVLIYDLNRTNRKLAFFFEAIQNEDNSLIFPEKVSGLGLKSLHKRLNQVNASIQDIRIRQKEQEQYFQTIMNEVGMGILVMENNGHISFANHAARNLLTYATLSHVKQLAQVNTQLYYTLRDIRPGERHLVSMKTPLVDRQLVIKASAFQTTHHPILLIAIQDIKGELDQHELDAWVRLIRVLIHEMVNTVTPISSLAETLQHYFPPSLPPPPQTTFTATETEQIRKGLAVIHERGRGLLSFIESYRKLTRVSHPQKKEIPLQHLVDRIKILLSGRTEKPEIIWEVWIQPETLMGWVDEELFAQVLLNLVKNAVEAAEKSTPLHLGINATALPTGGFMLVLSDNGPGIPPEVMKEIFVPFFTTKENGTGIGLSLSRQIVRMHGGSMNITSVPGNTQVIIQVPEVGG